MSVLDYDPKLSDGGVKGMKILRMQNTLSLLPGPFWLRMIDLDGALSMVQIELLDI